MRKLKGNELLELFTNGYTITQKEVTELSQKLKSESQRKVEVLRAMRVSEPVIRQIMEGEI